MDATQDLELIRLRACVHANRDDAQIWRWYADLMEDRRLSCNWKNNRWTVCLDSAELCSDYSFDRVIRAAYCSYHSRETAGLLQLQASSADTLDLH